MVRSNEAWQLHSRSLEVNTAFEHYLLLIPLVFTLSHLQPAFSLPRARARDTSSSFLERSNLLLNPFINIVYSLISGSLKEINLILKLFYRSPHPVLFPVKRVNYICKTY
jgi:hypothetical protein